ncbi:rubrerythrin family protein [Clostridium folliculivorans]|uniref:Rubrerythrin n=1 Tax=Clostridium folliculivorans TaxID=2886038 RepID=A0A9W5Y608_9CLOT|nr:rubrerythrin family protein [Clostridium folliculivorans]GKU27128.1 rubrerythrin [Clostridium folliculivorans]GKU31745.1 rubrerythrin [Clostridium folliculivorans]
MKIKDSETLKNLLKTFAGESRARNKYNLYAEKARHEGFIWIGQVFDLTASNEYAHAREVWAKYLGMVKSTEENLLDAMEGEGQETEKIYKEFEEVARKEGFEAIADFYKELREVEESHRERFKDVYDKVKSGTVFKSSTESVWRCMNCGYIYEGKQVPEVCPLCKFPRAYFEPLPEC